jgi:DnaK suppressor protein
MLPLLYESIIARRGPSWLLWSGQHNARLGVTGLHAYHCAIHRGPAPGATLNTSAPKLDKAFIERQRHRLTALRDQLLQATRAAEAEQAEIRSQSLGEAHESEDDAQKLAMLELDDATAERSLQRLTRIERALRKIEDGTYGFSDADGAPIPRERLEAVPEAINSGRDE